jgi:hypothetical protein
MLHLGRLARLQGDDVLERIFSSLDEDCNWHRQWCAALLRHAIEDHPANREVVLRWLAAWDPLAERAMAPFAVIFDHPSQPFGEIAAAMGALCHSHRTQAGLLSRDPP